MRYILAVLLLVVLVRCDAYALNEEEHLQFADGLYARELFDLAVKEYETFLKDYPATKKADGVHFRMGESLNRMGRKTEAWREFKLVYDEYKDSQVRLKAGYKLAELAIATGQTDAGIEIYSNLLKENLPDDLASASAYFLGEASMKAGKTNEAAKAFELVKAKYPKTEFYSYSVLKLGVLYSADTNKTDEVIGLYKTVLANPGSERVAAEALFQLAELHFSKRAYDRSADAYQKLIATYPKDPRASEAKLQAGWANHNAGLYAEALVYATEGVQNEKGPQRAEWMYLMANCLRQLLKNTEALAVYSELVEKYPETQFGKAARYEVALTYYKLGKFNDAIAYASKIKEAGDLMKDVYWLLGESYASLKNDAVALQYYRLLAKEFPKSDVSCDATYRVGHHLQASGQYKEAARYFTSIYENFPTNSLAPKAMYASAFCMTKAGMHGDAARDWSLLVQRYPDDPLVEDALYQKAISEMKLSRDSVAINSLRDLMKKYPKTKYGSDIYYWLGVLFMQAKKFQDSEESFREALKFSPPKEFEREVLFGLALALQKTDKLDESAKILQGLLATPVRNRLTPTILEWLAEQRFSKQEYKDAIEAATLLQKAGGTDQAWLQISSAILGKAHLALGDRGKALEAFKAGADAKIVTRYAPEVALNLGELMMGATNHVLAAKYFEQSAKLSSSEEYLGTRARAYAGLGRAAKAQQQHENSAKYFMSVAILYEDPELVPECLYEAADSFARIGKTDSAAKTVKELKDKYPDSGWTKKADLLIKTDK